MYRTVSRIVLPFDRAPQPYGDLAQRADELACGIRGANAAHGVLQTASSLGRLCVGCVALAVGAATGRASLTRAEPRVVALTSYLANALAQ